MIIADTGFWLALANRCDKYHVLASTRLSELNEPLITTWPVITETCHLLLHRLGNHAQQAFMRSYDADAFETFNLSRNHASRIAELMDKDATLPMDLADASLVILADHLGHGRVLSTDQRDFGVYRWKQQKPFENLLLGPG